jgi:putative hemin transport protein
MVVDREKPIEVEKKVIAIKTVSEFEINLKDEFLTGWSVLKDTHDFFGLLKKYKLDRKEALQLASNRFTKKVANDTFSKLLKDCTDAEQEIMIFVGSAGVIQIHTGYANRLETMGPWFNVLDPEFNLHLRADLIAETWIVEKPTSDGNVTSLELFADDGTLILQLFGKRKPGIPQSANWEALIHNY